MVGIERALPSFLARSRWFAGKVGELRSVRIRDLLELTEGAIHNCLAIIEVEDAEKRLETYLLPLACAFGRKASELRKRAPDLILSGISSNTPRNTEGVLFDGFGDFAFNRALLDAFAKRRRFRGRVGQARAITTRVFRSWHASSPHKQRAPVSGNQSNSTLIIGERVFLKLYRRLTRGIHPEIEVGRFLTERARFPHIAPMLGVLEYVNGSGAPTSLALLQGYVPSTGDAWNFTIDSLERFLRRVRGEPKAVPGIERDFFEAIRLLGRRTAELHHALSSDRSDPAFVPEPFFETDRRELVRSMRSMTRAVFRRLRSGFESVPPRLRPLARRTLAQEALVLQLAGDIHHLQLNVPRIRCHGDYHLRQVLRAGGDYIITDFEGEPGRPVVSRRVKQCALRDVASMLRSFDYAAQAILFRKPSKDTWIRAWLQWTNAAFLGGYFEVARGSTFVPGDPDETRRLLRFYLLEKAVYELGAELGYRPDWIASPLKGILELIQPVRRHG